MTFRNVLFVVLAGFLVTGCLKKSQEIEPVKLGAVGDADLTQFKEVDLKQVREVDLVEELHRVRADYKRLLRVLRQWYLENGYHQKAVWAGRETHDLLQIRTYPYLVVTEVVQLPEETGTKEVVEADELFDKAEKLYHEGQILPLVNNKAKLKQSLDMFRQIIRQYPQSTKAPEGAFFAAEILKEYFDENIQAVEFYKLALKMGPRMKHPVRFQLAVILDFRLHDRSEGLKMYRRVLSEESELDRTNVWFATNRIKQLLKEEESEAMLKSQRHPAVTQSVPATQPAAK